MRADGPAYGGLIMAMLDEAAAAFEECIDETVEAAKASYKKVEAKSYKTDDLVQDIADSWIRMLGKGLRLAQANRDAFESASPSADDPSEPAATRKRAQR
jgi:hypothetical protein